MFRNPRPNSSNSEPPQPSVGRPPSPHPLPDGTSPKSRIAPMALTTARPRQTALPSVKPTTAIGARIMPAKKGSTNGNGKGKGKPNGSILNFFKKAGPGDIVVNGHSGGLFFEDNVTRTAKCGSTALDPLQLDVAEDTGHGLEVEDLYSEEGASRFNEDSGPLKRRKLSHESMRGASAVGGDVAVNPPYNGEVTGACTPPPPDVADQAIPLDDILETSEASIKSHKTQRRRGPFVEESDSEDESLREPEMLPHLGSTSIARTNAQDSPSEGNIVIKPENNHEPAEILAAEPPSLPRESTSYPGDDEFADFEGMGDFDNMGDFDDEYAEGEEFVERRWMEEQRRLELAEAGIDGGGEFADLDDFSELLPATDADIKAENGTNERASTALCPICNVSFDGVSDQDASVHVNNCLDGNPSSLPERKVQAAPLANADEDSSTPKFRRPVRPARPGQENPFTLGSSMSEGTSAFSTLMSNHAEDRAWATAAAAEHAARGKPSYQRICPFYKILPGFFIVVDGFRYGAVKGTQAYFLSHFHSDHYIGLTASWCHGPIYCSRVTANLVRQQLRVDPKWVVALEFEKMVEVPGTDGVHVTMIPANHCPGSSLYLFEKVVGKGKTPRMQRVLHCGDFRACPAHLEHPLLRPDVMDMVTGKERQQKIDVCYLDTTYLNPKYAFPSQEEVIRACADMCVSLSKVRADETDGWEEMKRQRAGSSMVNFVRKSSDCTELKDEPNQDALDAMMVTAKGSKTDRGKLLVVVGTYSIGKERICLGIARALDCKIYAPPSKQRICACLEDPELNARLTTDPRKAQIHMTPLFEIRAETLDEYLRDFADTFSRAVGFRPTGWNYRPPNSRFTESPAVQTVLYSENWKSSYSMRELMPQRGSTRRASCFGVPYSEHSSFRELTMFCCALRIEKIIPTVNVGSAKGRERMKAWCERWALERKKNGLFKLGVGKAVW